MWLCVWVSVVVFLMYERWEKQFPDEEENISLFFVRLFARTLLRGRAKNFNFHYLYLRHICKRLAFHVRQAAGWRKHLPHHIESFHGICVLDSHSGIQLVCLGISFVVAIFSNIKSSSRWNEREIVGWGLHILMLHSDVSVNFLTHRARHKYSFSSSHFSFFKLIISSTISLA